MSKGRYCSGIAEVDAPQVPALDQDHDRGGAAVVHLDAGLLQVHIGLGVHFVDDVRHDLVCERLLDQPQFFLHVLQQRRLSLPN